MDASDERRHERRAASDVGSPSLDPSTYGWRPDLRTHRVDAPGSAAESGLLVLTHRWASLWLGGAFCSASFMVRSQPRPGSVEFRPFCPNLNRQVS
jgi:hypothetical protein